MSDSINHSKEECLIKMTQLLDASFGNQGGSNNHVNIIRNSILHLKNSLGFEKAEEVAQLVLKGHSEESVKELLKRNFTSGISIGNVEEMLQLVYVGNDTKNLKKAINFVQYFDACHQAHAYKALYDEVKFKKHTEQPEMLLLQKKIRQLVDSATVLNETKEQVDADCRKIISRIGEEIWNKDWFISEYVGELENALLNDNMVAIVQEFYTGSTPF
jgi:hypothetical protein